MDAITRHHLLNIANDTFVENDDGSISTVNTIITGIDGVDTLIPTVWDGQIVDDETAVTNALSSGMNWPQGSVEQLQEFDRDIHQMMSDRTTQEEADQILKSADEGSFDVDGGSLALTNETFDSGHPVWIFSEDEEQEEPQSLMAPVKSKRPVQRPVLTDAEKLQAFYKTKDELVEENAANLKPSFGEGGLIEKEEQSFWEKLKKPKQNYALGGLATAQKGITTTEGLHMANNRFQLDQKKADLDKDGKLSPYEEARGEAVQKSNADDPEGDDKIRMYHGGMPCGCEGKCDGSCGGLMSDPVSGNPIPIGSSAENVRDDISAMLSQDEYVLPANVVKWHGLKHIMNMQNEAEMGLMGMFDMGLIQHVSEKEEDAEEPEEVSEADDDISEEDVEIEVAAVKVDDKLDDDEEVEEVYPKTSKLPGMISTPKMVFMS